MSFDLYEIDELLTSKKWAFAKTMAGIPHSYTLRENWGNDAEFEEIVELIRTHGRMERWRSYNHHYLYSSGFKYWTMGAPANETILINRARYREASPYNEISKKYDDLFYKKKFLEENKALFRRLKISGRVLDIGCGTGLATEWAKIHPSNYVGFDPSIGMLWQFYWKHPEYAPNIHCCKFEDFYMRGFDTIIALYGTASFMKGAERIPDMLNEGGTAYLMYFAPDYTPVTSQNGLEDCSVVSHPPDRPDNQIRFTNYIIDVWKK